jgi:hypothetical protein
MTIRHNETAGPDNHQVGCASTVTSLSRRRKSDVIRVPLVEAIQRAGEAGIRRGAGPFAAGMAGVVGVALVEAVQGDAIVRGAPHGLGLGDRLVVDAGAQVRILLPILEGGGEGNVADEGVKLFRGVGKIVAVSESDPDIL